MASQFEKRKAKASEPEKEIVKVDPVYDRTAYDVFWDDEQRKFVRVILEYDLLSGKGRVKETKAIADSQPVAIYKMGEAMNRKVLKLAPKEE
jgi:hypothetical protein